MNFEMTVDLDGTPEEVWEFFSKLEHLYAWQPTLQNIKVIEGSRDEVGSVTELVYSEGRKTILIVEIIDDMRPPEFFSSTSKDMLGSLTNYTENFFEGYGQGTIWRVNTEFTFNSFIMRLIKPFIKGSLQKRLEADMERFKVAFASYLAVKRTEATAEPIDDTPEKTKKKKAKKSGKSKKGTKSKGSKMPSKSSKAKKKK